MKTVLIVATLGRSTTLKSIEGKRLYFWDKQAGNITGEAEIISYSEAHDVKAAQEDA